MKKLIWTLLSCVLASLLIVNVNCGEGEHNTYMQGFLYAQEESAHDQPSFDVETGDGDGDEEELEETGIDEASSEIVESHVPFPSDQAQGSDAEAQTPPRKTRRKRRRRRKRPRTSTHVYEEQDPTAESSARFQEPPAEGDYVDGVYVRRRPMKRRRRPVNRRPVYDELESEDVLPRRKQLRRPSANRTDEEQVANQHWDPITSTEEAKWKPLKTTTTESSRTTLTKPTTTHRIITFSPTTQQSYVEETTKTSAGRDTKKSNSTRPDMVVVHRRPVASNLPPTSAIIRRRLKPTNTSSEDITTTTIITTTTTTSTTTMKPNILLIKEEVPLELLPPGFIKPEQTTRKETAADDEYEFDDEALSKMINQQPKDRKEELKFKSDSIPKVKDEILTLLKTKTGSSLLSNILNLRNMSLEQLLQHRERGSSQRHQQLLDDRQTTITSTEPTVVEENAKNFTNYLIETKLLAQKDRVTLGGLVGAQSTENPLLTYKTKTTKDHYVTIYKEERVKDGTIAGTKDDDDDVETINNGQRVKKMDFPTTTTFTTSLDGDTSYVSKGPKSRIISVIPDREPRLFESMPDFSTKATTVRPLVTPTVPSQILFIQDTNHIDKSLLQGDKEINEEGLEYRRFEMRKLPAAVKSAIIASAAILAIAVLGFFVLLVSCRMRQKKRVLRKNSVYCKHNIHSDPDLRSSARSTSPVMDKPYHDQYYDGYGDRIDDRMTANRQYYLWRTLRRTFRYD
ncbi:uncharacterized protein LOC126841159 [Adelges cooleyi]|uniref:uncharacterized protein LOC126841159 n=1 Tax=Adelges cooleyi TaxID=133065 RepID=UPI002180400A|nr:uncharacterized protein LOC126841159 [Adelges cooleyi]